MTNESHNGDIDVPDEPQQDAEVLENLASSASAAPPENDFDIDLGSYSASSEDDVDINLDFGVAPAERRPEDDFELDFGSVPATDEESEVAEDEPEEESDA